MAKRKQMWCNFCRTWQKMKLVSRDRTEQISVWKCPKCTAENWDYEVKDESGS